MTSKLFYAVTLSTHHTHPHSQKKTIATQQYMEIDIRRI